MRVLEITNMYPSPERPALGTFIYDQVKSVRNEGVEIDVLMIDGWRSKLNYLWGFFRFWSRILTRRYDIIHAHYVFTGIIARTQCLYPVILTHHGIETLQGWQSIFSRIITRLVNGVIVRTQEMKEKLGDERAQIIPAGIDFELFKPRSSEESRRELELPLTGKKYVLVLWGGGEARHEKRLDVINKAVEIAGQKDPAIELVILTDKPHDMIPLYMNACDVLLLVSDAEGSPNVVKEAMACNLPVVSVPVGDVPELIGATEGCYLCSQDPADVAEKLLLVMDNPRRTDGRAKVEYLELGNVARRIVSLYEEVLRRKRHPG